MPSYLPPELVAYIIKYTLPPLVLSNFRERYDTLVRFHLVNKQWCALASTELFRHVRVADKETCTMLVGAGSFDSMLEHTASLWLGSGATTDDDTSENDLQPLEDFTRLFRKCTKVRGVVLSCVVLKQVDLSLLQSTSLLSFMFGSSHHAETPLTGALTLVLQGVQLGTENNFVSATTLVHTLPNVSRLTLIDPYLCMSFAADWSVFLQPAVFPSLQALSIVAKSASWVDGDNTIAGIRALAPELRSFCFVEGYFEPTPDFSTVWSSFHKLEHLYLDLCDWEPTDNVPSLRNISSRALVSLSFGGAGNTFKPAHDSFRVIKNTLSNPSPAFKNVETVKLLDWDSADGGHDEDRREHQELKEVVDAMGIPLEDIHESPDWMSLAAWESVARKTNGECSLALRAIVRFR